jgi:hypothetical protein
MTERSAQAPLFVDGLALADWLLDKLDGAQGHLARNLCDTALELLQVITLALKDRRKDEHVEIADELLVRLRALLRLAVERRSLTPAQYGHVLERIDSIGRQLGAWRRKLGPV